MKIAFIDTLGLCYDGSTLSKRGLGGSESAVILMSKELAEIGFDVTVFNDCTSDDANPGRYDGVNYCPLKEVENGPGFDVLIGSRSVAAFAPRELANQFKNFVNGLPDFTNIQARSNHKVLWMHDTFCDGDQYIEDFLLDGRINEIFTLSDFHTDYVTNCDHGRKRMFEVMKKYVFQTRNGIGMKPNWIDVSKKDPNLFVYNSSVTKGMIPLVTEIWPRIKQQLPDAKLTIIGGYYKFRENAQPDQQEQDWRRLVSEHGRDINFTGIITQSQISDILTNASYMIYPAAFPETYGISTLEALAHNVPLITCEFGALEETAVTGMCYKMPFPIEPNSLFPTIDKPFQVKRFVEMTVNAYNDKYLHQQKMYMCNQVKDICGWDTVALQWKQHFYHKLGLFLDVVDYDMVTKINHKVRKVFGRRFTNIEELQDPRTRPEQLIHIVTPVYNAENYIRNCITSVAQQDYNNYRMYIVDDCSTDKTWDVINETLEELPLWLSKKFFSIRRKENMGAVYNQVETIRNTMGIRGDDIIMLLDGDDWLINDPNIFHKYNNIYNDDVEFTYGSCWSLADRIPLIAQEYPPDVRTNRFYRNYKFNWNMPYTHLRTFRAGLLQEIEDDACFKDEHGNWLKAGGDTAVFYNLIERAEPENVVCVPDIVYIYNDLNPINDYKVNGTVQTKNANTVIGQTKKITELQSVPSTEPDIIIKEPMSPKKILIAIPTARNIEVETFKSIYDLEIPKGYTVEFRYSYGYQIDQVRNLIAHWTVNEFDYLLAVDSDIKFDKDTLKKLLALDKPVATGIYRQRMEPLAVEIYDHNMVRMPFEAIPNHPIEIGGCGFGCVLVKKEVFRDVGYPYFEYKSAILMEHTFSEDVDFCLKARKRGYAIWLDPTVRCGHIGSTTFVLPEYSKKNAELARLRELHDMPLLPQAHVDYLCKMKQDGVEPKVIYDIGACVLHWTNPAKAVWPDAKIIPIEAMEEVAELYHEKGFDTWVTCLLSDVEEEVEFYQNLEHPGGNSLFKENKELSPMADQLFPEENKVKRKTHTLDDIVDTMGLPKPDLIKMDIQGAELKALKGATKTLENCNHLILELQHKDYNFGAPKAQEVIDYLKSIGFEMVGNGMFCGSNLGVDGDYHFIRTRH